MQELTQAAAMDVDAFYRTCHPDPAPDGDVLVLSVDGKGIVMRPEALRPPTRRAAAASSHQPATRLSPDKKRGRKRMAEVGAIAGWATDVPSELLAQLSG